MKLLKREAESETDRQMDGWMVDGGVYDLKSQYFGGEARRLPQL